MNGERKNGRTEERMPNLGWRPDRKTGVERTVKNGMISVTVVTYENEKQFFFTSLQILDYSDRYRIVTKIVTM